MSSDASASREGVAAATTARRGPIPLVVLLSSLVDWIEERHLAIVAAAGFDDVRRAHNAVFAHVPSPGIRLTDLASRAGISKQAMGELVTDLVAKGYFRRVPDPDDGRAKLIVWGDRGMAAHEVTVRAFAQLEQELAETLGEHDVTQLRDLLTRAFGHVSRRPGGPPAA